jgi:cell division protein ZapA
MDMEDKKNKVTVEIMGQQYTILGRESEEYMHSIALHVDKKMRELSKTGCALNNTMLAVLTALNISNDYYKLERELEMALKEASKPGKELEDARYQLRKAKEESARLRAEIEDLKQRLGNSQEEASNIYSEWLKTQKVSKEAGERIQRLEEQKKELEMQLRSIKGNNRIPGQRGKRDMDV